MSNVTRRTALSTISTILAGGGLATASSARAQAPAANLEVVDYLLPAPPTVIGFAPWMIAAYKGYYAQEGIRLNFIGGRGGADVAKQVGAGNVPLGHGSGDVPILARALGVPVKSVALLGGRSLTLIAVRDDSPVQGPKDLKGKIITTTNYADSTYYALLGVLASVGLTKNDCDIQSAGQSGVWQLFAAGKAEAMTAIPEWVVEARNTGIKVRVMSAYDYFGSMSQSIVASDDVIQKRPAMVRTVVKGSLRGLSDIMTDPKTAARDYIAAVPTYTGKEAFIEEVFSMYAKYVYPGQKVLGMMDPARMEIVQKFYVDQGIVRNGSPVNDLFTNQFVA